MVAGAQAVTKAEAAVTAPAGSAPPRNSASGVISGEHAKERAKEVLRGGLYDKPRPQPDPRFELPQLQRRHLSNGLEVLIVENHKLPVVNMNLVLKIGAAADMREQLTGLASLTADMLDEGTAAGRTALDVSNQLAAIGARLGSGAGYDSSAINLLTLTRHLDRALEIYADVLLNPSFPPRELERLRASRVTAIMQRRDNASEMADLAYSALLYGSAHPYGNPLIGTEASVRSIGEPDVRRFYETYYRPNNATLIVAGDVTPEALIPQLEKTLAHRRQAAVPTITIAQPPPRERATLYLVDRPGSAQSVIAIGQVGLDRRTPDYFPLLVMNTLLGGQFTSRVNMNLRENKGYTYGARTSFSFRRAPGPFVATAGVQTMVTKESIVEFLKELRGVRGEIPITPEELNFAKQAIIRGYPRGFETPAQVADRLADLALHDLPDDYFNNYIARIRAVTLDDVRRAAANHLDPSRMVVLVVGDRQAIENPLRSLENLGTTLTFVNQETDSADPTMK
ncbi:MAG: pitrilysin family protein [Pyrinomonadaceae bacterium]